MNALRRTLSAILMLFVAIGIARAQTSNGTVIGAVTDSTGSAIVGAVVTITSVDNGAVRSTTTNQEGTYRIESVLAGIYNVSASATGFETTVNKGLEVPSSSIVTSSMVLKIGSTADHVEVSADNAVLNTDNGQVSGTIGELEISSLPIASLNPYELALTLPGVMNTMVGGFSNGVDFNVGGGRPRANNFLIEGQDNNDAGIQGQGLQPGNDEAIKEVTIIENAYTAEYGHGAGSVSNLIYKSGTNDWHGAVYERLQNSSLDTVDINEKFNGITSNNKYRENQPGFRIGGPIKKNKIFGFASYQWDYFRSTANLSPLTIPTAAGFATLANYSGIPRVANLVKAYGGLQGTNGGTKITPPAIPLGPDPLTGVDRGIVEMGTVERNLGADDNAPEIDLKGDYIASEKDTLTLRFVRTRFTAPYDVFNFTSQLPGLRLRPGRHLLQHRPRREPRLLPQRGQRIPPLLRPHRLRLRTAGQHPGQPALQPARRFRLQYDRLRHPGKHPPGPLPQHLPAPGHRQLDPRQALLQVRRRHRRHPRQGPDPLQLLRRPSALTRTPSPRRSWAAEPLPTPASPT